MSDEASGGDMISCPYFDFYIATAFEVIYGSQGKARQGKAREERRWVLQYHWGVV